MNTKLTLRLDEDLIRAAKRHAGSSGKSVSQLVADYFAFPLMDLFAVAAVDRQVLECALRLGFADPEDAVIHEATRAWGAAGIVTRNGAGFGRASLPVFDPGELLAAVLAAGD